MAGIGVALEGFEQITRYFERTSAFDKMKFADFVGAEAVVGTEEAFKKEEDPVTHISWPELSEVTLAKKHSGKKLFERGQLKRSSATYIAYPDGSTLHGSNKIYSRIHNEGGRAGRGRKVKILQRRFLGVDQDFYPRIFADRAMRELIGVEE